MRKILAIILICTMSCCVFGCYKSESKEDNMKEYEDIISLMSDKYGDYISVSIYEYDNQIAISLFIREEYLLNEDMRNDMPAYEIIEGSRLMINEYLDANPDCRLAKQLDDKIGFLRMETVKEYFGASQAIIIFEVTDYRTISNNFIEYDVIDIEWLDEMYSITREEDDYNDYIESMYDYISQTGDDITRIAILEKKGLEESEQEKWREEVKSKFPLVDATTE